MDTLEKRTPVREGGMDTSQCLHILVLGFILTSTGRCSASFSRFVWIVTGSLSPCSSVGWFGTSAQQSQMLPSQ